MIRILAAALCLAFAAPALAANSQQALMKTCNQKADGLKGEPRKDFISKCLKGEDTSSVVTPQQRMKDCNAKAKADNLKGDQRKKFMSECLKAS